MKSLILLGGFGTRLRPFTCQTPKPLLPILNRPGLAYQLDLIKKHKMNEVTFCLSYMSRKFNDYFSSGKKFDMKINYVYERDPLGTGGAIKNAEKYIDCTTMIFNGDILTDINLSEVVQFHKSKKAILTIVLIRVKDPTIYGLVETDKNSRIQRFLEKPSWDEVTCNTINAGIYVFEPELLKYIPQNINYSVERSLFPLLLEKKEPVYGFVTKSSYWIDMGTVEKYLKVHHDILKGDLKFSINGKKKNESLWTEKNVSIDSESDINGRVLIGSNSIVEKYAQLSGMVSIGRNCRIKQGAQIIDSVILDNTVIGEGSKVEGAIVGHSCRIDPHTVLTQGSAVGDNTHITKFSSF